MVTKHLTSSHILSQKKRSFMGYKVQTYPKCPMSTCNSLSTNDFSLFGIITWLFSLPFLRSIFSLLSSRLSSSRQSLLNWNDYFATSAAVIFFWNSFTSLIFFIQSSWFWAFLMLSLVNEHTAAASPPLYNISAWISL